jgi:hypothetical protein
MEYDHEFQSAAETRLPVPVISAHALLGVGGLMLWAVYLLADVERVAWVTAADLGAVAVLGLIMAFRWVGVYRGFADPRHMQNKVVTVPPERHFPLPVVVAHGILATTTIALVLCTVLLPSQS